MSTMQEGNSRRAAVPHPQRDQRVSIVSNQSGGFSPRAAEAYRNIAIFTPPTHRAFAPDPVTICPRCGERNDRAYICIHRFLACSQCGPHCPHPNLGPDDRFPTGYWCREANDLVGLEIERRVDLNGRLLTECTDTICICAFRCDRPVSYTHLTLPTIVRG